MSYLVDPPFDLGQTLGVSSTDDGVQWVGAIKQFPDVDPSTGAIRSARVKTCIAVRNTSGTTLYGKRLVKFASGSFSAVDAYTRLTNDRPAGVTDEHLSSAGDLLVANTAAAGGATNAATGGKAVTATGTEAAAALGLVGTAVSSAATADDDALVLVKLGA